VVSNVPPQSIPEPMTTPGQHTPVEPRVGLSRQMDTALGAIVTIYSRSLKHKHFSIAEFERRVMPAISTQQFRVAEVHSQQTGAVTPIAVVLWANVSDELNRRLSAREAPPLLMPDHWLSGTNLWIMDTVGPPKAVQALLSELKVTVWADRTIVGQAAFPNGTQKIAAFGILEPRLPT